MTFRMLKAGALQISLVTVRDGGSGTDPLTVVANTVVAKVLGTGDLTDNEKAGSSEVTVDASSAAGVISTGLTLPDGTEKTSGLSDYKAVEVAKGGLCYFWCKEALWFAQREAATFKRASERDDLSYARQLYFRISVGATLIDSDYAMVVVARGKGKAI